MKKPASPVVLMKVTNWTTHNELTWQVRRSKDVSQPSRWMDLRLRMATTETAPRKVTTPRSPGRPRFTSRLGMPA